MVLAYFRLPVPDNHLRKSMAALSWAVEVIQLDDVTAVNSWLVASASINQQ
jgi:hypothetical protein